MEILLQYRNDQTQTPLQKKIYASSRGQEAVLIPNPLLDLQQRLYQSAVNKLEEIAYNTSVKVDNFLDNFINHIYTPIADYFASNLIFSSGKRKREKEEKGRKRQQKQNEKNKKMKNPSGGSKYAQKQPHRVEIVKSKSDAVRSPWYWR